MARPSLEALELSAQRALAAEARLLRDRQIGRRSTVTAVIDTRHLAEAAERAWPVDRARSVYLAEAFVTGRVRQAVNAHDMAVGGSVINIEGAETVSFEAWRSVLATETVQAARDALVRGGDGEVLGHREGARSVIEALREAVEIIGLDRAEALGFGDATVEAETVLDATQALWDELSPWALRAVDLDLSHTSWADREHTRRAPTVSRELPPATWSALGTRMFETLGFGPVLRRIVSELRPAATHGTGVYSVVSEPGSRTLLLGRPTVSGEGAARVMGAVGQAVLGAMGGEGSYGQLRGCDRALDGALDALTRRLLLEPLFVSREAGVGRERERVLLEALYLELYRLRADAAMASFCANVLHRDSALAERFTAVWVRAVGASPEPVWGAEIASRVVGHGGPWGSLWAAMTRGALYENTLAEELCEKHDEDWFRNPGAGETLSARVNEGRREGLVIDHTTAGRALAKRCEHWMNTARRR